jgi:hypothetical protein
MVWTGCMLSLCTKGNQLGTSFALHDPPLGGGVCALQGATCNASLLKTPSAPSAACMDWDTCCSQQRPTFSCGLQWRMRFRCTFHSRACWRTLSSGRNLDLQPLAHHVRMDGYSHCKNIKKRLNFLLVSRSNKKNQHRQHIAVQMTAR